MKATMSSRHGPGTSTKGLLVLVALGLYTVPAAAITWGQKDRAGKHPNVGTILASIPSAGGVYHWCSGTLVHERVFLTAGHCLFRLQTILATGHVDKIWVSFDYDYDPLAQNHTPWLEVLSTNGAKFTLVGYGSSFSFPPPEPVQGERQAIRAFGIRGALLPSWLRLQQQGMTGDGGTCYGGSGGPTLWGGPGCETIVVASTSWGDVPCV